MEDNQSYLHQQALEYKTYTMPLFRYLPWLSDARGKNCSRIYDNSENGEKTFGFPVYDATLMSFIREVSKTPLMDRNYLYVYSRNAIRSVDDEKRLVERATIKEWGILRGILSRYVLGGRTKGVLWSEAASNGILFLVLSKMKEILEFWDQTIK